MSLRIRTLLLKASGENTPIGYYVDAINGSDSNDGTTPAKAWKTLSKLAGYPFNPGDHIYLKRGCVWRETWYVNSGGSISADVVYDAFGSGVAPEINGCDVLTGWSVHSGSIYKASYTESIDTYLLLQDREHLTRVGSIAAISSAGQYFPDNANNLIYVRCTDNANPSTHVMEIGARYEAVVCDDRTYITFRNLHIYGAGGQYGRGFGLKPTWNTPSHITIENCEIDHCYYSGLWASYATSFTPISNFTLRNCSIHHNLTFGARIDAESASFRMTNVLVDGCVVANNGNADFGQFGVFINHVSSPEIKNCVLHDNSGTLEWSDNLYIGDSPNAYTHHCISYNSNHTGIHYDVHTFGRIHLNLSYNNGYNGIWIEEHQTSNGDETTIYHNTCWGNREGLVFGPGSPIHEVSGVTAQNNIFGVCHRASAELNDESGSSYITGNTVDYNVYYADPADGSFVGQFLRDTPRAAKTFAQWKIDTGWDSHSLNTNPLVDSNGRLQAGSPALGAGTDVGISTDFYGTLMPLPRNIGAFGN